MASERGHVIEVSALCKSALVVAAVFLSAISLSAHAGAPDCTGGGGSGGDGVIGGGAPAVNVNLSGDVIGTDAQSLAKYLPTDGRTAVHCASKVTREHFDRAAELVIDRHAHGIRGLEACASRSICAIFRR